MASTAKSEPIQSICLIRECNQFQMAPPNLDATSSSDSAYAVLHGAESRQIERAHHAEIGATEMDKLVESEICKTRELTLNIKETEDVCSDDIDVMVPPDGGWGWVIVFASFMCNLVVDGIIFSYGTFLEGISAEFGVTRAQAALVGSMMSGFYLIVGPFASAIANKFGFRLVAVLGAVLGSAAFVVSSFATNVQFLCVTYGLIGGKFGSILTPADPDCLGFQALGLGSSMFLR